MEVESEEEDKEEEVTKTPTKKTTPKKKASKKKTEEKKESEGEGEEEEEQKAPKKRETPKKKKLAEISEEKEGIEENEEDNNKEKGEETPKTDGRRRSTRKRITRSKNRSRNYDEGDDDDDTTSEDDDKDDDYEEYDKNIEDITDDSVFATPKRRGKGSVKKRGSKKGEESSESEKEESSDNDEDVDEEGEKVPKLRLLPRILKGGRDAKLVKEWAEKYKVSPVAAVADLINLVIESCGCPYRITPKKLASGDVEKILESLISSSWAKKVNKKMKMKKKALKKKLEKEDESAEEDGNDGDEDMDIDGQRKTKDAALDDDNDADDEDSDDVVNSAVLNNKKSRERFLSFWDKVIQISKDGFLYDDYLLSVLISWINSLTNSTTRSFRQTATSVALQITHSLIKIIQEMNTVLEKNGRQQTSEKKRNSGRLTAKLRDLEEQAEEIQRNIETITETVNTVYTYVIGIRFRDIVPSIRAECIAKIAEFITLWPEKLLANGYLKYLAWGLSDKTASVRLEAIRAVTTVYRENTSNKVLRNFWERFKKRIKEMICDTDVQVAVETINFFKALPPAYFTDEEFHEIFRLISSDVPEVRRAIGSFVMATVFSKHSKNSGTKENEDDDVEMSKENGKEENEGDDGEEGNEEDKEERIIQRIIEVVQDFSGLPSMPCYVVDALWNNSDGNTNNKILKYWKTMTSMLLRNGGASATANGSSASVGEEGVNSEPLSEAEQRTLAGILSSCCKLAAGIPITQATRGPVPSGKEGEQLRVQQDEMTAEVAGELPNLLEKYGAEESIVEDILEIIPTLSLPAISALRLEQAFTGILTQVCGIFSKSVNDNVLCIAAAALSYMISGNEDPHKQSSEAEAAVTSLAESIVPQEHNSSNNDNGNEEKDMPSGDNDNNEVAMKRLLALYQQVDLHENKTVREKVISWAKATLSSQDSSAKNEDIAAAVKVVYQDILWKFSCINIESIDDVSEMGGTCESLCAERDEFVQSVKTIFTQKERTEELKDLAYNAIIDVASVFTPNLKATLYRQFAYELPDEVCGIVREHFLRNVYCVMSRRPLERESTESEAETTDKEFSQERVVSIAVAYAKACCSGALGSGYSADVISLYHLYRIKERTNNNKKKVNKKTTEGKKKKVNKKGDDNSESEDEYEDMPNKTQEEEEENDDNEEEENREELEKKLIECQNKLDGIAKATLRKIREHDKSKEWEVVGLTFQRCFTEVINEEDKVNDDNKEEEEEEDRPDPRKHFNDVSKWLSFSYGPVPTGELRVSLLRAVQECVIWALDKDCAKRTGILAPLGVSYLASKFVGSEAQFIKDQIEKKTVENSESKDYDGLKLFMKTLDKALKKVSSGQNVRKNLEKDMENEADENENEN